MAATHPHTRAHTTQAKFNISWERGRGVRGGGRGPV